MHTPGPWFTEALSTIGHCAIVDADGFTIANPSPMGMANARLIAAAPAMLEALQELVAEWDAQHADQDHRTGYTLDTYGVQLARSAIASATKD